MAAEVTIFSALLVVISFIAYRRVPHRRLLFVGIGFLVFLVKGILLTVVLAAPAILGGTITLLALLLLLDTAILVLLAWSILGKT